MTNADMIRYAIFALVGLVLILRLRSIRKVRKLRIETLWIVPALYLVATGFLFWQMPPDPWGWLWIMLAALLGAALGWQRGRMIAVMVDPETHRLNQQSSPAAVAFIVILVGVRLAMRSAVTGGDAYWHPSAALVTEVFIASAAGLLCSYRIELFLRARRLLRAARSG